MIIPTDKETISAMVGSEFADNPPDDFLAEYQTRLMMTHKAGSSGPLGMTLILQLLRDFKVEPGTRPELIRVSDWSKIPLETRITCEGGRTGLFMGLSGEGMMLIRFDGYKGQNEVPIDGVTLSKKIVEGVEDEEFETPEEDKLNAKQEQELARQELLKEWGAVGAGTPVIFDNGKHGPDGKPAEFMDVEGHDRIALYMDGKKTVVKASNVKLAETAST